MKMKALVTGATGFIGANVVRALLGKDYKVRALVRPDSERRNLEGLEVELAIGDVRDRDSIKRAIATPRGQVLQCNIINCTRPAGMCDRKT